MSSNEVKSNQNHLLSRTDRRLRKWRVKSPRCFFLIFKLRWVYFGILTWIAAIVVTNLTVNKAHLKHSTGVDNHYTIAWTYVALAVAVVSILYPLALGLRDSMTNRAISLYEFLLDKTDNPRPPRLLQQYEEVLDRIAGFRYALFDKQIPFLVTFVAASVIRVLMCLSGIGIYPSDSRNLQLYEPQVYLGVYLLWAVWIGSVWQRYKPFQGLETLELHARGLKDFEARAKPWQ